MSSLTEEWQKQNESGVEYKVSIKDFANMMETYEPGQVITSRTFYIGECSFSLQIYPNGYTSEDRGNVSVYLCNKSDWRVRADCKFSVKDYCKNLSHLTLFDVSGSTNSGWGFRKFLPHNECHTKDLLDNKTFVLKAEIKVLEEEVTVDRKLTANSIAVVRGENSKDCSEEIRKLKIEIDNMKTLVQNNSREMDNLRRSVEKIKISNETEGHNPMTECPVCLEIVRRPMRLIQCGMGHILCEHCYKKSREEARGREEGRRDMGRCHICMDEYIGRPAVLEKLLGLID